MFALTFVFIRRLVKSPTGSVFEAIRENEDRAQALVHGRTPDVGEEVAEEALLDPEPGGRDRVDPVAVAAVVQPRDVGGDELALGDRQVGRPRMSASW